MVESTPEDESALTSEECREKGNICVREENFKKAIQFYSSGLRKAIALNQQQDLHILFSNRSLAYLKDKKYYYALSDAEKCIEINPDFIKGYFRKAEILKECCLFDEAIINYGRSLKLEPTNNTIIMNFRHTAMLCNRENMLEKNVPFVGAGVGVIFAIVVVILDQLATKKPAMHNPMIMVSLVICIAAVGFLIAKVFRYFLKLHRKGLISEPAEMSDEFLVFEQQSNNEHDDEDEQPKKRNRYSKSQARLRFKKGKS